MALIRYKPTTPGRRGMISSEFEGLSKVKPPRALVEPKPSTGGRNHHGRVTSRFRGGGHKKQYRIVDFRREKDGAKARVATIEYDPNRTARIALLHYGDGEKRYIIAPDGLKVGDVVESGVDVEITPGNRTALSEIAIGTEIHDIELKPGKGGQIARAAGAKATLMAREGKFALVRLPSGEQRKIHVTCRASIGQVGNLVHEKSAYGKAGRRRWLGRKPHVRGSVMNPVDHPHGGGEGRCPVGRDPVSPWGQLAKGKKTRCKKNPTSKYIVSRRKK